MRHPGAADLAKEGCEQVKIISCLVKRITGEIEGARATVESGPSSTFGNKI